MRHPIEGTVTEETTWVFPENKKRADLLRLLRELEASGDHEIAHSLADQALLDYIADPEVTDTFNAIPNVVRMTQPNNVTPFPTPHLAVPSLDELIDEFCYLASAYSVVNQLVAIRQTGGEWTESQLLAWERVVKERTEKGDRKP